MVIEMIIFEEVYSNEGALRIELFQYPRMNVDVLYDSEYIEMVRVLRADFVVYDFDDRQEYKIVSIVDRGDLPVTAKIVFKKVGGGALTIQKVVLYSQRLNQYKQTPYIDKIFRIVLSKVKLAQEELNKVHDLYNLLSILKCVISNGKMMFKITIDDKYDEDFENIGVILSEMGIDYQSDTQCTVSAFDNMSKLAYKGNCEDEVLLRLIDIAEELLAKGDKRVVYHYNEYDEPVYLIEVPDVVDRVHGWLMITRYKRKNYNITAYIVNSDVVMPVSLDVARAVLEYYDSELERIAVSKASLLKHLFESVGVELEDEVRLGVLIRILEGELVYGEDIMSPEFKFYLVSEEYKKLISDKVVVSVLRSILPLSVRELSHLKRVLFSG